MPTSVTKRNKEKLRQEKQRDKELRRRQRKEERGEKGDSATPGVDPDIAGIVPGPQPIPDEDEN
jgi:hypothetical protein